MAPHPLRHTRIGDDTTTVCDYPSPSGEIHRSFDEDLSFIKRTLDDCSANIAANKLQRHKDNEQEGCRQRFDQFTLGPSTGTFFNVSPITSDEISSSEDAANNDDNEPVPTVPIELDMDVNMNITMEVDMNLDLDIAFLADNDADTKKKQGKEEHHEFNLNMPAKQLLEPMLSLTNDAVSNAGDAVLAGGSDELNSYAALIDCTDEGGIVGGATDTGGVAISGVDYYGGAGGEKERRHRELDIALGGIGKTNNINTINPCVYGTARRQYAYERQAKKRTYSDATPSKHCHICSSRPSRTSPHVFCANLARGTCRKTVCKKCFDKHGWDIAAAADPINRWKCTHCRSQCPPAAQCFIYGRTTARRRQNAMRAREATRRAMLRAEKLTPGNGNIAEAVVPIHASNSINAVMGMGTDQLVEPSISGNGPLNHWLAMDSSSHF